MAVAQIRFPIASFIKYEDYTPMKAQDKGASDAPLRPRKKYDRMAVLERIRLLVDLMRVQANWNQVDFARKSGLTTPKLSHYLSGRYRPDLDSLASIAEKLGVSVEWLVFGSGPIWSRDIENRGIGQNEAVLAFSSVLNDIADSLRRSVIPKEDEEDPLGIDIAIENILADRLDNVIQGQIPA
jgi:transcriptional regulator with XRE-family HTH domain